MDLRETLAEFTARHPLDSGDGGPGAAALVARIADRTLVPSAEPPEKLRVLFAHAALANIDGLNALRVIDDVCRLAAREFDRIVTVPADFPSTPKGLRELAAVVSLKRFLAGQVHWEMSGIPRSWPLQMNPMDAIRALGVVAKMGGWGPCFEAHIGDGAVLMEREYTRCYLRMAQSMELQPEVRAMIGASWLHSSETMRVTPQLAWINRLFLDNGGVLLHMGPAPKDAGFLVGSAKRRQLYESGEYKPRVALYVWPRKEFLDWGRRAATASK